MRLLKIVYAHCLFYILLGPRDTADKCEMESTSTASTASSRPCFDLSTVRDRSLHR